jgi:hypothetical protein
MTGSEKLALCAMRRMNRKPRKKFIAAPATRISARCQAGFAVNARASPLSPFSPSMAQKPPSGSRRSE